MDVVALASQLVSIPSANPMGRSTPLGQLFGEKHLAQTVEEILRKMGGETTLPYPLADRPNVVAWFDAGAQETILFEAHLDTVPAENMTIPPFGGEVREGKLWGRGSVDDKGPMASMICAIDRALQSPLKKNVLFAAVSDEEYQFSGVRHLLASLGGKQRQSLSFAVVAEPTLLCPVLAHKGVVRWHATTKGKAAHSSTPELGQNAIYQMAEVVQALRAHAESLRQSAQPHPTLGNASLSVGTISGGSAVNIVPDYCSIEIDRRVIPGETPEKITEQMSELVAPLGASLSTPVVRAGAFEIAEKSRAAQCALNAARQAGVDSHPSYVNYCTDASFYQEAGIEAVVIGPGSIAQAHSADEWIAVQQLQLGVETYWRMLTL